jgi:hypothetical protein
MSMEMAVEIDGGGLRGKFPAPAGCQNRILSPKLLVGGDGVVKLFWENWSTTKGFRVGDFI